MRDEIIRMAKEAGAKFDPHWGIAYNVGTATFERFYNLAVQRCDKEWPIKFGSQQAFESWANSIRIHEREQCAKLCETHIEEATPDYAQAAWNCARQIRARGEKQ